MPGLIPVLIPTIKGKKRRKELQDRQTDDIRGD